MCILKPVGVCTEVGYIILTFLRKYIKVLIKCMVNVITFHIHVLINAESKLTALFKLLQLVKI